LFVEDHYVRLNQLGVDPHHFRLILPVRLFERLCLEALREGQTTDSTWAPPLWIPYVLMSSGMTLLSLQLALQLAGFGLAESERR